MAALDALSFGILLGSLLVPLGHTLRTLSPAPVPDGDFRTAPASPFARAIDAGEGVSDLDRALLHLGRSPAWTP